MWEYLALVIGTLLFLLFLVNWYIGRNQDYWTKRGIYTLNNNISLFQVLMGKKFIWDNDPDYYNELGDKKFGGTLELGSPGIYVKDLDLAKNIFVKDFEHFVDRRSFGYDPVLSEALFFLTGQKWKDMRGFLSPTFTSGKIRRMFTQFEQSGKRLKEYVGIRFPKSRDGGHDVIMPEITRRFTVDVIGGAAFGMETDALKNSDSVFYKMADKAGTPTFMRIFRSAMLIGFPKLSTYLGLSIMDSDVNNFFISLLSQALKSRKASVEKRDDFLQLLVEAQEGTLKVDESEFDQLDKEILNQSADSKKPKMQLTESMAIAQGFLFFVAGFDTVGNFLNIATYVLAANPEVQERLFDEMDEIIRSCDGKITYEGINRMDYLDMVVSEIMRLHPPAQRLERKCTKDYTVPGTDCVIPKDTIVGIAAEGIHSDEKYYPDPKIFDPERFTSENKGNRNPYSYMPFGIGPRNCIGMRFALIESKVAIANLVHSFKIEPTAKTPMPPKIIKLMGARKTENDLELRLTPRSS